MRRLSFFGVAGFVFALMAPGAAVANPADAACLGCHRALHGPLIEAFEQSPHRPRGPDATGPAPPGCTGCHGPSSRHLTAPGRGEKGPDVRFGKAAGSSSTEEKNKVCLGCHQGRERQHWEGSSHQREGVGCTDCHRVHEAAPSADPQAAVEACIGCHTQQKAQIHYAYSHPLRDGQMRCSACHNPHGEAAAGLSVAGAVNDVCYRCHAEKRGPFLWEHPPASEDCTLCHAPHGSNHVAMLNARPPWLCQQCHLAEFHPSTAYSGTGLPGDSVPSGTQGLLAKSCLNCHAQVHGSNHPSGGRLTR